jgi:small-conductance mechanosensitive channel
VLAAAVLGIDIAILLVITIIALGAVALTASLALGLGLRRLSENVAASRYVSEDINEGDQISVNGFSGTVERVGQTATTVRGENGRLYIIPNGYFMEHVVEKEESTAEGS